MTYWDNGERAGEILLDRHDGTSVVKMAAVVRRGEQGDEGAPVEELVAVFHDLVGAHHEAQVVLGQKGLDDVRSEAIGHAPIRGLPTSDFLRNPQMKIYTDFFVFKRD